MYEPSQKDETLVMLTLAGDSVAFETLVVRWQNAVNAAAYSVLRNRWLAEDAAQDAFITAWMKLNVLRDPAKFGVWVCQYDIIRTNGKILDFQGVLAFVGAHSIPFPALKGGTN